ncbi:hypothetical protein BH18ACT15_BH18ACT15_10780 [soil metagenome]
MVLDPDRKKMSKSKGNVVLPTDVLDQHGSDAVRYWAASARLGVDPAVDDNVYLEGRRLATKLRNAARLIARYEGEPGPPTHPLDRALIARLGALIERVTGAWEAWDHAGALGLTEAWFWSDLCDNYLELSKARAYAGHPSALGALRTALDVVLRLFAPFVPFVTEDVYAAAHAGEDPARPRPGSPYASIHRAAWPAPGELPEGQDTGCFDAAVEVLTQVRRAKSQAQVSVRFPVTLLDVRAPRTLLHVLTPVMDDVERTVNAERSQLTVDESLDEPVASLELAPEVPGRR